MAQITIIGCFKGAYKLDPHHWQGGWRGKQIYEFTNSRRYPLEYLDSTRRIRPDNHIFTDMGSIPLTLQSLIPVWFAKDRFPKSYIFHDSGYKNGGHWMMIDGAWLFVPMTRREIDDLLHDMILAEGGSDSAANTIWAGVRAGGYFAYHQAKIAA